MHFGAIIVTGVVLVFLTLAFLRSYTNHGQSVVVPSLEGLQVSEATTILRAKGLRVAIVDSVYQRNAIPGAIIDQTPRANNDVKEGRTIYLTVFAQNPPQVLIPNLRNYPVRLAIANLNSLGFSNITIYEVPYRHVGLVISVEYRGRVLTGEERIPAGSPLRLVVGHDATAEMFDELTNDTVPQPVVPPANPQPVQQGGIDSSLF